MQGGFRQVALSEHLFAFFYHSIEHRIAETLPALPLTDFFCPGFTTAFKLLRYRQNFD